MTAPIDLDKLSATIKELEARLRVFVVTIETIDVEISQLEALEIGILDNLAFLKRDRITVIASVYRKVKANLLTVKSRMSKIKMDKHNIVNAKKQVEAEIQKTRLEYKISVVGPNNILKFRRRNGNK